MSDTGFSDDMIRLHDYAMNIIELKNNGVKEMSIDSYIELLDRYIEALYFSERAESNLNKLVGICKENLGI